MNKIDNISNQHKIDYSLLETSLSSDLLRFGLKDLLPDHVTPELFIKTAATAILKNPSLLGLSVSRDQLLSELIYSANLGLVPDGRDAVIILHRKYISRDSYIEVPKLYVMYFGWLACVRNTGSVAYINCKPIYQGDSFETYTDQDGEYLKHRPAFTSEHVIGAYAIVRFTNGERIIEYISESQIDYACQQSSGAWYYDKNGTRKPNLRSPWHNAHRGSMAQKSVLIRCLKKLPNSSHILDAASRDIDLQTEEQANSESFMHHDAPSHTQIDSPVVQLEAPTPPHQNQQNSDPTYESLVKMLDNACSMDDVRRINGLCKNLWQDAKLTQEEGRNLKAMVKATQIKFKQV